jgi:hypothetical protein
MKRPEPTFVENVSRDIDTCSDKVFLLQDGHEGLVLAGRRVKEWDVCTWVDKIQGARII